MGADKPLSEMDLWRFARIPVPVIPAKAGIQVCWTTKAAMHTKVRTKRNEIRGDNRRETTFPPQHRESVFLRIDRIFLSARLTCPTARATILGVTKGGSDVGVRRTLSPDDTGTTITCT